MEVPFVGSSYRMDARSFDVQRSINLYPIVSESSFSKSKTSLRGCAGLRLFAEVGGGAIRGCISSTSGRAFVVSGQEFYELDANGTATLRGTLNTQTSRVSIAENINQIMIVDGTDGWIFTKATNAFTQITDVDFPTCSVVTYQDGYFIVVKDGSQDFYISAINNGTSWGALDFAAAESSPDNLISLISDNGNLWLFGNRSTEVYQNTGAAAFPFERINGAVIQTGCAAAFTVKKFDSSIAWLGVDEQGRGVVWQAQGYGVKRLSTRAIERRINEALDFTDSYAWVYQQEGSLFYVLQIKGLDSSLVYDASTGEWHERMYLDPVTNTRQLHRGSCHFFFAQKTLVGDRENGNIYELRLDVYDDNGDEMVRERIAPIISDEKRLISHSSFELDMEVGVGLTTGQGSDPKIMLQYSDDNGYTYSSELWTDIGTKGNYQTRVVWRQLGMSRDRVYKVSVSDPVFVQINAAYLNSGA